MDITPAPPGAGKTVMGLKIVADKKQPALVIVHRKQLLDQWVDRIEAFLAKDRISSISARCSWLIHFPSMGN